MDRIDDAASGTSYAMLNSEQLQKLAHKLAHLAKRLEEEACKSALIPSLFGNKTLEPGPTGT
jgi:hypothetical protein